MQNSLAICGAFKGAQQATRYEVAAMVARAVAAGDAKHASKKDVELLKKLCVEFKDELAALGAKTDKLDKRVTKLEKGIGSWQISGRFKFDVKMSGGDNFTAGGQSWNVNSKHEWNKDVARMFFRRQITEDTYFDSQFRFGAWGGAENNGAGDTSVFSFKKFYIGTKLPFWGIEAKIGRSQFDFESDYDLYTDEDSFLGDWRFDGFWFTKKWAKVKADFVVGRGSSGERRNYTIDYTDHKDKSGIHHYLYVLNLKWTPTDKLTLGALGYWMQGDGADSDGNSYANWQTYGITAGYKFTDGIALKGIYYWQKYSEGAIMPGIAGDGKIDDSNYAFKAILDIKQNVLKFTDLWVEYAQMKNGFGANNGAVDHVNCWSMGGSANEPGVMWARPINNEVTKTWFITANQKWNKKWSTFVRFQHANFGTDNVDNAWEWGVGVKYKLNPAITFMLAYDEIKYGENNAAKAGYEFASGKDAFGEKDRVIFFQTDVKF